MAQAHAGRRLKMKALQAETGLSKQAIQFYLREGLLPEPEKPKPNVAYYTDEHVQRIHTIKRMQQERAMPLRDIKTLLDSFDNHAGSFRADLENFELALHARLDGDVPGPDQTLKAVTKSTGVTLVELTQLDLAGVIAIKRNGKREWLDYRDRGIVQCWMQFKAVGYENKEGFNPEFLRPFAEALEPFAQAVVDNFFKDFDGTSTAEAAQKGTDGVAVVNGILTRMHTQAILRAVHNRIERDA